MVLAFLKKWKLNFNIFFKNYTLINQTKNNYIMVLGFYIKMKIVVIKDRSLRVVLLGWDHILKLKLSK